MKCFTLTGADEKTPLPELQDLSARAGVEIGLLLTCNPEGRNRYPSRYWLEQAVGALGSRCAVHLCGLDSRELALSGALPWLRFAGRIQINGRVRAEELAHAVQLWPTVITQYHDIGPDLSMVEVPGHALLVDNSGGRGITPTGWRRPQTAPATKPVGFAGGLGPENLFFELPLIERVAQGEWWIDMESRLRETDDWFSLSKAHKVVDLVHAWGRGEQLWAGGANA
jgi:hypothetical protein